MLEALKALRCMPLLEAVEVVLEVVLYALKMLEGLRRVLLCMLEVVDDGLCSLEVLEGAGGARRDAPCYSVLWRCWRCRRRCVVRGSVY